MSEFKITVIFILGFILGSAIALGVDWVYKDGVRSRAIETKVAAYNTVTGEFEWIDKTFRYVLKGK